MKNDAARIAVNQLAANLSMNEMSRESHVHALIKEARRAESMRSALASVAVSLGIEHDSFITAEIVRQALQRDVELAQGDVAGNPPEISILKANGRCTA